MVIPVATAPENGASASVNGLSATAESWNGASVDVRLREDYEAIKKFSTNERMIATRCIGPVKKRANVLNRAWCVNTFTQLTREVQRRANALHFTFTYFFRREPAQSAGATARSAGSNPRLLRVGRGGGSNTERLAVRSNPRPLLHVFLPSVSAGSLYEVVRLGKGRLGVITQLLLRPCEV